jgi:hypothetical protein
MRALFRGRRLARKLRGHTRHQDLEEAHMVGSLRMRRVSAAAALLGVAAVKAAVPVTPANLVDAGLMSATCASLRGSGNGLSIAAAIDSGLLAASTQCTGQAVTGLVGSASSGASFANGLASASAGAQASAGVLHLGASLDTSGSLAGTQFPIGIAQAGFADTFTVNLAGHQGESGYLLVDVHVSGVLDATRNAGSASFTVSATKNNLQLQASNPGYVVGTGNGASTDRQQPSWSVATYPPPDIPTTDHRVVNETITFSVPVTYGTTFEMAVLGLATAGTRSQTGAGLSSSNFNQTVQWLGVHGVLSAGGQAVQGYTLTSGSGINWAQAAPVPEPDSAWLLAAGLFGLAGLAARRLRPGGAGSRT